MSPAQRFTEALDILVTSFKSKPADDKITYVEMVGILNLIAFDLMTEAMADAHRRFPRDEQDNEK